MRIVIDARMYGLEHAGIGRYILNLINQIEKISAKGGPASGGDTKNDYYILLRKEYFKSLRFKSLRFKKIFADYPHYSIQEQILLPIQLIKLKPDLVHFPHFNTPILWFGKQIVTIHDLIKHDSRGLKTTTRLEPFYWLKYFFYLIVSGVSILKANRILTPSQDCKNELMKRFNLKQGKIVVTYEGVGENFFQPIAASSQFISKLGIKKPYLAYTGSLYPHKNVENLIKALLIINANNGLRIRLVITCARSVFYYRFQKEIIKLGAEKLVRLVGFLPDEKVKKIYSQAEAFVFPSLMEGFGLPGLEAMAAGLPVLASDIPVFREVYKEAAFYFDPRDPHDIAEKISKLLKDKNLQKKLIAEGQKQVVKYSWGRMAKETLAVYQNFAL